MMKNQLKTLFKKILKGISPAYRVAIRNEQKIDELQSIVLHNEELKAILLHNFSNLRGQIDQYGYRDQMLFWWSMSAGQHSAKSLKEVQEKFYQSMPAASGGSRIMQLGGLYLLQKFKEICDEHNLKFWLIGGTLLGAARHKGFIPWDDDIDVAMMHEDFEKLSKIIKTSESFEFKMDLNQKTRGCICIRFRLKNEQSPFYIDVMLNDFAGCPTMPAQELNNRILQTRQETSERLQKLTLSKQYNWQPIEEEDIASVTKTIHECRSELPPVTANDYIYRSVEIISPKVFEVVFPAEKIFPLAQLVFEGQMYPVPGAWDEYLRLQYGDYYLIPSDCYNHHMYLYAEKLKNGVNVLAKLGITTDNGAVL